MIIDIILIVVTGKYYMQLAEKYGKSKWGYAILGVATYYIVAVLFALILGLLYAVFNPEALESLNEFVIGLIALAVGVGGTTVLYYFLEKSWKKNHKIENKVTSIDDIGKDKPVGY